MKKERRHFRKKFEEEYLLSKDNIVTGVRYNHEESKYTSTIAYNDDADADDDTKLDLQVSGPWLFEASGISKDYILHIHDMDSHDGFVNVPSDKEVFIEKEEIGPNKEIIIEKQKVSRIKFIPEQKRSILDVEEVRKRAASKKKNKNWDTPRKDCVVPAHWKVVFTNGSTTTPNEKFVKENLSQRFLYEVKQVKRGFVPIPVGDSKPSHLYQHPHLKVVDAPIVNYVQSGEQDLCVPYSLASALHNLGFCEEANQISEYGRDNLQGGTADALGKVAKFARNILPRWIQISRRSPTFNWKCNLIPQQFSLVSCIPLMVMAAMQ